MIRLAMEKDIPKIGDLLRQVCLVHHKGRPDIFKAGRKYSDEELAELLRDKDRPILVAVDDVDCVQGYCFCVYQQHLDDGALTAIKTLYIDDLCVDENLRGQHIGHTLYDAAVAMARENGCYNVTLNVWSCNPTALRFYESLGMTPLKIGMEQLL
ncbi:MAG: GNAT family N-acetyltransferase [Clostridia bacterium]|nr:GNAT family N-acetyltransferase [Clostridia bacterium]